MTIQAAFLFPGQGSQTVGMGAELFAASAAARTVFTAVDDALGFSLSTLCFQGPEETLRTTINAQPALMTVSLAYLAAFQEALSPRHSSWTIPLTPGYTAGHSVGEYAALVTSGMLDLRTAALLVRERGRLMHEEEVLCPSGMAAIIGMAEEAVQQVCEDATRQTLETLSTEELTHPGQGRVIIANYNAPGQIVISGELRALEAASALAKARGAKRVIPLSVSGAFHSPVMAPATEGMAHFLQSVELHDATIPLISNVNARPLTSAADARMELARQIAASVQWTRSIEYLVSEGVTTFFEIGPGQALASMIKRIARGVTIINIGSVPEVEKAVARAREIGLISDV